MQPTQTSNTNGNRVASAVASAKTAEQRKTELKAFLAQQKASKIAEPETIEMPTDVKMVIERMEGATINELREFTVPTAGEFRGYISKKTGLPGWSCGDGFAGKVIAKDGKYAVAVKISVSVFESK